MVDLEGDGCVALVWRTFLWFLSQRYRRRRRGAVCVRREGRRFCPGRGLVSGMGGSPGLRSLLTSACSFLLCCPYIFILISSPSAGPPDPCLTFSSSHASGEFLVVTSSLVSWDRECLSPCRSSVLMEVFLPKTHTLSPACVSWFTKMDILNRNDDSKLKTGYKCDVSIIGGQGRGGGRIYH